MSRQTDQLARADTAIDQVLKHIEIGRADRRRWIKALDLAIEHAEAWAGADAPSFGERGGSSTPESIEDRQEHERVVRMATTAVTRLPELATSVEADMQELYQLVQRLVAVVPPAKQPAAKIPGCRSCARTGGAGAQQIGGHFAPAMPESDEHQGKTTIKGDKAAAAAGLCRWCADHAKTQAAELEVGIDDESTWPPVRICHLLHTRSARAAGSELAKILAAVTTNV